MMRGTRLLAGVVSVLAVSGCQTSDQTSMNEFWGKETSTIGHTYEELTEGRVVVIQDLSVPISGVDEEQSFNASEDWDESGFVIMTACGNGDYLEDSDLLEFIVTAKNGAPEDTVEKAIDGDYWEYLTPGQCPGT
ncbi:MAG: hypothetical protein ACTHW1_03500 [Ancrocorticia sp.]